MISLQNETPSRDSDYSMMYMYAKVTNHNIRSYIRMYVLVSNTSSTLSISSSVGFVL